MLSWLLGGVYYPITVLPEWLSAPGAQPAHLSQPGSSKDMFVGGQGYWSLESHLITLALWATIGLSVGYLCCLMLGDSAMSQAGNPGALLESV